MLKNGCKVTYQQLSIPIHDSPSVAMQDVTVGDVCQDGAVLHLIVRRFTGKRAKSGLMAIHSETVHSKQIEADAVLCGAVTQSFPNGWELCSNRYPPHNSVVHAPSFVFASDTRRRYSRECSTLIIH